MKKIMTITMIALLAIGITTAAYAADQTETTAINATVNGIFSLAFYNDANILYNSTVPFTSVNPTEALNLADGRSTGDGKSDVGLNCTSNSGLTWYLKVNVNAVSDLAGNLKAYIGQPTNRNWGSAADGSLTYGDWFVIATSAETVYTAGTADKTNTPEGTLATLSYALDGSGLADGSYTATVTYTLTETV